MLLILYWLAAEPGANRIGRILEMTGIDVKHGRIGWIKREEEGYASCLLFELLRHCHVLRSSIIEIILLWLWQMSILLTVSM